MRDESPWRVDTYTVYPPWQTAHSKRHDTCRKAESKGVLYKNTMPLILCLLSNAQR